MQNYLLDLETLGIESKSIVLSIALIPFDLETDANTTFQELCDRAHFFKLEVKDQHLHGRTCDQSTLEWWNKQSRQCRNKSLKPLYGDLLGADALSRLRAIVKPDDSQFWTRGGLDQTCLESLCRTYGVDYIVPHNAYYDIRTAMQVMGKSPNNSPYIEGFVVHDPVHDCARDIISLLRAGKTE